MYDNENTSSNDNFSGLRVTTEMKRNWLATSKWASFFAILGFVVAGIYLLFLGSFATVFQALGSLTNNPMLTTIAPMMSSLTIFIAAILVIQIVYHYFHLRFSMDMKRALNFTDQGSFEQSWKNLRNHFRIFGILVIAILVSYVVIIAVILSTIGSHQG